MIILRTNISRLLITAVILILSWKIRPIIITIIAIRAKQRKSLSFERKETKENLEQKFSIFIINDDNGLHTEHWMSQLTISLMSAFVVAG